MNPFPLNLGGQVVRWENVVAWQYLPSRKGGTLPGGTARQRVSPASLELFLDSHRQIVLKDRDLVKQLHLWFSRLPNPETTGSARH